MPPKNILIDMTYMQQVSKGNKEFMDEMLSLFISKTPLMLEEMVVHLEKQDWEQLGFWAHKLKATYAYIGVSALQDAASFIERSVKKKENFDLIPENMELLLHKTPVMLQELQEYKKSNKID